MHDRGIWSLRALTVMPDHLHLLFRLGSQLQVSQCIARLKATCRPRLQAAGAGWQPNYYDHRLRPDDSIEATLRYIWVNPYREGLVVPPEPWPYFYCDPDDWKWFEKSTDNGDPPPAWLT